MRYSYFGEKLAEAVYKGFLWSVGVMIFSEIIVFFRFSFDYNDGKYTDGWALKNVIENFVIFIAIILATILLNLIKEIIILIPLFKNLSKKFNFWLAKKIQSPGIFYKTMHNTATMHVNYLDDFIHLFFLRVHGRIVLFNPDPSMLKSGSPVMQSLLAAIKKGNLNEIRISSDMSDEYNDLKFELENIEKQTILIENKVKIFPETPRFAAYFGPENGGNDPLYFMWRPKTAPYKDKIIQILRSNHYADFSHSSGTDFPTTIANLIADTAHANFNLKTTVPPNPPLAVSQ